jgi:hypothetical protein
LLLHLRVNFSFAQIDWPYGAMVARQIPVPPPELPEGFAFGKQLQTILEVESQTNHEQSRNRVTIRFLAFFLAPVSTLLALRSRSLVLGWVAGNTNLVALDPAFCCSTTTTYHV